MDETEIEQPLFELPSKSKKQKESESNVVNKSQDYGHPSLMDDLDEEALLVVERQQQQYIKDAEEEADENDGDWTISQPTGTRNAQQQRQQKQFSHTRNGVKPRTVTSNGGTRKPIRPDQMAGNWGTIVASSQVELLAESTTSTPPFFDHVAAPSSCIISAMSLLDIPDKELNDPYNADIDKSVADKIREPLQPQRVTSGTVISALMSVSESASGTAPNTSATVSATVSATASATVSATALVAASATRSATASTTTSAAASATATTTAIVVAASSSPLTPIDLVSEPSPPVLGNMDQLSSVVENGSGNGVNGEDPAPSDTMTDTVPRTLYMLTLATRDSGNQLLVVKEVSLLS